MIMMKQIPQILTLLVTVTTVYGPAVDSWPASVVPARRLNDTNRPNDQRTGGPRPIAAGMESMDSNPQSSPTNTNLLHSNRMLTRETSISNHPSSQTMQPKDSSRLMATNKQNFSRPNYPDFDSMSEGSGSGPQQIGKDGRFMKLDDTEDSGDDDGDNDEDYDYTDTLDSGSGLGQIKSTTTKRPGPVVSGKAQLNDPYNPFRPPSVESDSVVTTTTGTLNPPVTTRPVVAVTTPAPLRISFTTPAAPSTTTTTTFYPKISTSTTTSRNLVASGNKYNGTRAEADYDYEDEIEDDDSADSSAFEDNEPSEMIAKPQTNSSSYTQANNSNFIKSETATKLPVASSTDQTAQPKLPMMTETPAAEYDRRQTTSRPPTTQKITSKPAITKPTVAPQPTGPRQSHKFEDLDVEDEERVPDEDENEEEEDEEEDEEELDDDIVDNDRDEEEPILGLEPIKQSNGKGTATRPNFSPKYPTANLSTTRKPRPPTFSTTLSPSQNRDDLANFQPSTTTYNPNVISATTFATNQISSVPIFSSTPASPTPTANVVVNNPLKPYAGSGSTAPQPVPFAQPTRIPTFSSAYRPTLSSATDKPDSRVSTLSNPSNRPPPSQVTTTTTTNILHNGLPHDNEDTLTKQIYAKALELYQKADKKVRAAWEAVWPPNLNLDSSAVEPLLNQPLFFMLALGGTVIGLVLLMMLVVYIITYQIQPKDDDSSIY